MPRDALDALLPDGSAEPLEVRIVVGGPDAAVPMQKSSLHGPLREPF